ncbi:SDR family oxidoreductase [Myxococcota bacterium]|nr:SDR family oxidoreductase [Myxococcota bacterium]
MTKRSRDDDPELRRGRSERGTDDPAVRAVPGRRGDDDDDDAPGTRVDDDRPAVRIDQPERASEPKPPQHQPLPGIEQQMTPAPIVEDPRYRGSGKLEGKVAVVTGGDSGIGRAVAISYAKEGADVALLYLNEHEDAAATRARIEQLGRRCTAIAGDVGDERFCFDAVARVVRELGGVDLLVNNAAEQHVTEHIEELSFAQLEQTFRTNVFGYVHMVKACLPHLGEGSAIINSTSINAYDPTPSLLDYAMTKGAIVTLTRGLAKQLSERKIRVNAVAPGPVWTPLIVGSFPDEAVPELGQRTQHGRAAEPAEIAPCYVFLASDLDARFVSGQVLHPNGGEGMYS